MDNNVFETLNGINVNGHTEELEVGKQKFTYLSWAWAWQEVKKAYPDVTYNVHKFGENRLPYVYDPNTGYMVFTDVTINGLTHEMFMPVLDGANKAMKSEPYTYDTKYKKGVKCEAATMFDINKAIMRCLVKNLAMFGLGLYLYAGDDLPESEKDEEIALKNEIKEEIKTFSIENRYKMKYIFEHLSGLYGNAEEWKLETLREVKENLGMLLNGYKVNVETRRLEGEYNSIIHEDAGDRIQNESQKTESTN